MFSTTTEAPEKFANYHIIIPLSMAAVLIATIIDFIILALVIFTKRLHTVTHLLICNGSISSIFYCVVQCVNYVFLDLIPWETNDVACRWRGFFGYMVVAAVLYSYLAQAISRFFIAVLSNKYRWATLFRTHIILIIIQWFIVLLIPLPALLTEDIYHRPYALCWVPKEHRLHIAYTVVAYYLIPALLIFAIYIYIYCRIKRRRHSVSVTTSRGRSNRDLEVLRNIMILVFIYTFGAIPIILYLSTSIGVLYEIGIVSVSFTVAIEKIVTLILDRDMRNMIKLYFRRSMTQIRPIS
jgi:hypothetical protein